MPEELQRFDCSSCSLGFFSPEIVGDSLLYQDLGQIPWYYQQDKHEYLLASEYIAEGASVVEIGCGEGHFSKFLPPNAKYKGIEFNEFAVKKAKDKFLDVNNTRLEDLSTSSADVVVAFQVLEHLAKPRGFLKEAVRIAKPGGIIILSVPNEASLGLFRKDFLNYPPHHVSRWGKATLQSVANLMNLNVVTIEEEPPDRANRRWIYASNRAGLSEEPISSFRIPPVYVARYYLAYAFSMLMRDSSFLTRAMKGHTISAVYEVH
jgi:SAM-dependent methyltransferase